MKRCYLTLAGVALGVLVVGLAVSSLPESASAREIPDSRANRGNISAAPLALSQGFWSDLSDFRSYVSRARDELLAGRTPMPECHGKAGQVPSGGEISMTFKNGVLAWACVSSRGDEHLTVELTNTYTAPLTVRAPSDTALLYDQQSISGGLMFMMGKYWGQAVIPVSERAQLVVPRNSLPVTIELSTDHEIVLSGILTTAVGLVGEVGGIGSVQKLLDANEMVDCLASALKGDVFGTIPCASVIGGVLGSKSAALVLGLVYTVADFGPTVIGQFMQDWRGPSSITLNYEPPPEQNQLDQELIRFDGDWFVHGAQMNILWDATSSQIVNVGPCTDPFEPGGSDAMCRQIRLIEFSESSSGGIIGTITEIRYETWEGDPPPPGFEPSSDIEVGDSFKLEFVDNNLLRTTWLGQAAHLNGQGNPYWCNSQTPDENIDMCGA